MREHRIRVDRLRDRDFLSMHPRDPVTGEAIKAGDEIIYCSRAGCSACLSSTWSVFQKNCKRCSVPNTHREIPTPKQMLIQRAPKQKASYFGAFLFFLCCTVALSYFTYTWFNYYEEEHRQKEELYQEISSLNSELKETSTNHGRLSNEVRLKQDKINALVDTINNLRVQNRHFQDLANSYPPIMITDISLKPDNQAYNTTVTTSTKFVYSKASYNSLRNYSGKIELQVKIIKPDGTLMRGNSSPIGYSFDYVVDVKGSYMVNQDVYIQGYGNPNGRAFEYGSYTYEIWTRGRLLKRTQFYVYY